jgi:hypothetical protein
VHCGASGWPNKQSVRGGEQDRGVKRVCTVAREKIIYKAARTCWKGKQ